MANTEKEAILTMLLIECVRRLTHKGKNPIHITNGQIQMNLEAGYEVDFSDSFDANGKFILKLIKGEELVVEEGVEIPSEVADKDEIVPS